VVEFRSLRSWLGHLGLYPYAASGPTIGSDPLGLTEARLFKIPTSKKLPDDVNKAIQKVNDAVDCNPIPGTWGLPGLIQPILKPSLTNPADSKVGIKFDSETTNGSLVHIETTVEDLGSSPKVKLEIDLKF